MLWKWRSVQHELHQVLQLRATSWAFAALKSDGTVVSWGDPTCGGDIGGVRERLKSIRQLVASSDGFVALDRFGRAICWGASLPRPPAPLVEVKAVAAACHAFAALQKDGTVCAWGDRQDGATTELLTGPTWNPEGRF